MNKITISRKFDKQLKILEKKFKKIEKDLDGLFYLLARDKIIGDRVKGLAGFEIYKARLKNSSSDSGKSGGFRVIYYAKTSDGLIIGLSIYSKSEKSDISKNEILKILKDENLAK